MRRRRMNVLCISLCDIPFIFPFMSQNDVYCSINFNVLRKKERRDKTTIKQLDFTLNWIMRFVEYDRITINSSHILNDFWHLWLLRKWRIVKVEMSFRLCAANPFVAVSVLPTYYYVLHLRRRCIVTWMTSSESYVSDKRAIRRPTCISSLADQTLRLREWSKIEAYIISCIFEILIQGV